MFVGHVEEISTLALQHDTQILASASGARGLNPSQICFWDLQGTLCRKTLSYHEHSIVGLAYSRDDRFLISIGMLFQGERFLTACFNDYEVWNLII